MSMYESTICTVYKAKNGFVVECNEPPEPAKTGQPAKPAEREHTVAKNAADVLKIVKMAITPADAAKDEYSEAFDEAASSSSK